MYRCPKCHTELPADARFCKHCGFNQTNARIAAMSPPVQGVQRQVPPEVQQSQAPLRTIQPSNRQIPQPQPANAQQGLQLNTNMSANQQNGPETPLFGQQPAPGYTPTLHNTSQLTPSANPPLPQGGAQSNKGTQPPMQQQVPVTPRFTTPQQGNAESFQGHPPRPRPGGSSPQTRSGWVQQSPVVPQEQPWGRPGQGAGYIPEQIVRTSTPPLPAQQGNTPNTPLEPLQWGLGPLPGTPLRQESLAATSKAAQHWRESWLDRQHSEAGPAVDVSRGQASVPEPLLAMQNSIARMRAIILPKNATHGKTSRLRPWLPIILLICLISGLGAYILSTYSSAQLGANPASSSMNVEPTLTLKTTKTTTVAAGQPIPVHGEHFGQNDTILFFLGETQLKHAGGKSVSTQSNDQGKFDAMLPIPATQLAGEYTLEAKDNQTGQHAFLDIQTTVGTPTNTVRLSVPSLSFGAVVNQGYPNGQSVSITNTSDTVLQWNATAMSDNQTGWLSLSHGKTSGQLNVGATDKILVTVLTAGLASSLPNKPYTGEVIFTIADQGQISLPVQLTLSETAVELAINPNPISATTSPNIPGGCQPTTLTLINLSNIAVIWNVQTDGFSQQRITLDGRSNEQGQLFPTGSPGDTKVIRIGCNGVQLDNIYGVNVYYNGSQQKIPISITKG